MIKKILLSSLLASGVLVAQDQAELNTQIATVKAKIAVLNAEVKALEGQLPPNEKIMTHTEFGYMQTTGNTQTKTYNLDSNLKKGWNKNVVALVFDGQYADDHGVELNNKYFIELNYDYQFTDSFSLNYLLGYRDDKFSSFDYQYYTGPGAKYKAIATATQVLSLEGNILYSVDKDIATSVKETYSAYRAKGDYTWQTLANLKFSQELSYRGSFENSDKYFVYSKTAFSSKISDIFSAGLSYKVDYVNQAGIGIEHTDTTFTANLIMDY